MTVALAKAAKIRVDAAKTPVETTWLETGSDQNGKWG